MLFVYIRFVTFFSKTLCWACVSPGDVSGGYGTALIDLYILFCPILSYDLDPFNIAFV